VVVAAKIAKERERYAISGFYLHLPVFPSNECHFTNQEYTSGAIAERQRYKISRKICVHCDKPASFPMLCCDSCLEKYRRKTARKKASGICTSCTKPSVPGHIECQDCKVKRHNSLQMRAAKKRLNGECYYCDQPAREGHLSCEGCVNRAEDRRLAQRELPAPALSIFEALDLKHKYLEKTLHSISLPKTTDLYMDTEIVKQQQDSNDASNVFEWSTFHIRQDGRPNWSNLRTAKRTLSDEKVTEWAPQINRAVRDRTVVAYGSAKPEYYRIRSFQKHLPSGKTPSSFKYYDVQMSIVKHLFSYDPMDEFDPEAKIYMPYFNLEYLCKRLNKGAEGVYAQNWKWPTMGTDSPQPGKSAYDVSMMFNFVHAIRHAQNGNLFKPPLPSFTRKDK
jgi:hypothetical protein